MRQLKNYTYNENKKENVRAEKSDMDTVNDYIGKYKDMDEDALLVQLMSAVKQGRESGSFDDEQLSGFAQLVSPQLNDTQRAKLDKLIDVIKTEKK